MTRGFRIEGVGRFESLYLWIVSLIDIWVLPWGLAGCVHFDLLDKWYCRHRRAIENNPSSPPLHSQEVIIHIRGFTLCLLRKVGRPEGRNVWEPLVWCCSVFSLLSSLLGNCSACPLGIHLDTVHGKGKAGGRDHHCHRRANWILPWEVHLPWEPKPSFHAA